MSCLTPFYLDVEDKITGFKYPVLVPCGKCEECLKQKQSSWIARLSVETLFSKSAFFITLTYDEKHLPFPEGVNKKDCQLFFKTFRKYFKHDFKYFLVSEYGSVSSRPHYHLLLFVRDSVSPMDLTYTLERCWKNGQHKIGSVDIASISYCAKYCLKSRVDSRHIFRNKTFSLISKRPAIGRDFLVDENGELTHVAKMYVENPCFEFYCNGRIVSLPRYYRDFLYDEDIKLIHRNEVQAKYSQRPSALTAKDKYFKRLEFERKQKQL